MTSPGVRSARKRRHGARLGLAALLLSLVVSAGMPTGAAVAVAAGSIGVYPTWAVSGTSGAYSAVPAFPESAAFPATSVVSTGTTLRAPAGVTAFLGSATAFGSEFGSTRSQPYLTLAPQGVAPSTTTIEFATPPPAGWGFALGDIDADWAFIQAWQGPGETNPLTVEQLGFRSAGNYCDNTPKPQTCGVGPYADAPVWVTAPETFDGIDYTPSTLRGNSLPGDPLPTRDTSGAYGWFVPTAPVQTLRITFGVREGFPTAQLWLAAPAPKVVLAGTVVIEPSGPVPAGTSVQVNDAGGAPLRDATEAPYRVPVDPADGSFEVELEQSQAGYQLVVVPPSGYVAPPPTSVPGVPDDPVTLVTVLDPLALAPAPSSEPSPGAPAGAAPEEPALAASGGGMASPLSLLIGGGLVFGGSILLLVRRAARRRVRSE